MIEFRDVSKRYEDGTLAVKDLSLTVEKGEIFVLIGPSGCGKTTTMKMVNRLIDHTDGKILIDGKEIYQFDIFELRRNIGYVLQQIALFPHLTVEENICRTGIIKVEKRPNKRASDRIDENRRTRPETSLEEASRIIRRTTATRRRIACLSCRPGRHPYG